MKLIADAINLAGVPAVPCGNYGTPLCEVVNMASLYPARSVGVDGRKGSLEPGKDADILIADGDFNVQRTFVGGREVTREE